MGIYEFSNGFQIEYEDNELQSLTELEMDLLNQILNHMDDEIISEQMSEEDSYEYILSEGIAGNVRNKIKNSITNFRGRRAMKNFDKNVLDNTKYRVVAPKKPSKIKSLRQMISTKYSDLLSKFKGKKKTPDIGSNIEHDPTEYKVIPRISSSLDKYYENQMYSISDLKRMKRI